MNAPPERNFKVAHSKDQPGSPKNRVNCRGPCYFTEKASRRLRSS